MILLFGLGFELCCGFVLVVLAAYAVFYAFSTYNSLVSLKNNMDNAWANIDVLLKQRSDLIPNLVEVVKGYMKHEKDVLTKITELRTAMLSATSVKEKAKESEGISASLKTIFAVAENYPNLKASANFIELQRQLTAIENQIADRREFFNNAVLLYNTRIQMIPDAIIALTLGMKAKEYFKVSDEEKKDVQARI